MMASAAPTTKAQSLSLAAPPRGRGGSTSGGTTTVTAYCRGAVVRPPAHRQRAATCRPGPSWNLRRFGRVSAAPPQAPEEAESAALDAPGERQPVEYPGAVPFLGHALEIMNLTGKGFTKDGLTELCIKASKIGPVVKVKLAKDTAFVLTDPAIITEMAVRRQASYNNRFSAPGIDMIFTLPEGGYGEKERQEGGDPKRGLVFIQGALHKRYRSLAMQSLAKKETKIRMDEIVAERAARLVQRWTDADNALLASDVAINLETQRFTTDIIGQAAFSYDFQQLESDFSTQAQPPRFVAETNSLLLSIIETVLKDPLGLWRFFDTSAKKTAAANLTYLGKFEDGLINSRREAIARGEPFGDDFLGSLLAARDEDGSPLPSRDIKWAVHDMIIAENDTTATSFAAGLAMLALHPEWQDKVRAELEVLEGKSPSASDVEGMKVLDAVVRETLRLYSAAGVFGRVYTGTEPDNLGGYTVQPGDILLASPHVLGRSPELWTDPEKFDPGRFLPGGEWCVTTPRNAWLPFGLGARSCIGGQLALLEMRVGIAALLQRFEMLPPQGSSDGGPTGINADGSLEVAYDISMAFPDGLKIRVKPL